VEFMWCVFTEIASNCPLTWSAENCSIPSIYVVLAYLQELVENDRESQYEVVISELTRLHEAVGDHLPFKIYARLVIALKILVMCCQKLFFFSVFYDKLVKDVTYHIMQQCFYSVLFYCLPHIVMCKSTNFGHVFALKVRGRLNMGVIKNLLVNDL